LLYYATKHCLLNLMKTGVFDRKSFFWCTAV